MAARISQQVYKKCLVRNVRGSVWLADDHLLLATPHARVYESYLRFYFTDIQAIVMQPDTNRWWRAMLTCFIGLIIPVIILIGGVVYVDEYGSASLIPFAVVALLGYVVFAAIILLLAKFRPACRCQLRTFTQWAELKPVYRMSKYRALVAALEPLIRAAQANLEVGDLATIADQRNREVVDKKARSRDEHQEKIRLRKEAEALRRATAHQPAAIKALVGRPEDGVWHRRAFITMGLLAVANLVGLLIHHRFLFVGFGLVETLAFGFLIAASVRQHGSSMPTALKVVIWTILGITGVHGLVAAMIQGVFIFANSRAFLDGGWQVGFPVPVIVGVRLVAFLAFSVASFVGTRLLFSYRQRLDFQASDEAASDLPEPMDVADAAPRPPGMPDLPAAARAASPPPPPSAMSATPDDVATPGAMSGDASQETMSDDVPSAESSPDEPAPTKENDAS